MFDGRNNSRNTYCDGKLATGSAVRLIFEMNSVGTRKINKPISKIIISISRHDLVSTRSFLQQITRARVEMHGTSGTHIRILIVLCTRAVR